MKNERIVQLTQSGVLAITSASLPYEESYKVLVTRRGLKAAAEKVSLAERELLKECGVDVASDNSLIGDEKDIERFVGMHKIFLQEDTEVKVCPVSYRWWHELQRENECLRSAAVEDALENVMWLCPEE